MHSGIRWQLRAGAAVFLLLVAGPTCSSSSQGPGDGTGGTSTGGTGGTIGGSGGAIVLDCGGSNHKECSSGQACLRACYGDSGEGTCVGVPATCDASVDPVCGCDGKTYDNECLLQQAALRKDYAGACVFTADNVPLAGVWSGPGIRMIVTATGATISFGCARGTIDQPLRLAPRFYTFAGPITREGWWQGTRSGVDGGTDPTNVTYDGSLFGTYFTLSVMGEDRRWEMQYQDVGEPACP